MKKVRAQFLINVPQSTNDSKFYEKIITFYEGGGFSLIQHCGSQKYFESITLFEKECEQQRNGRYSLPINTEWDDFTASSYCSKKQFETLIEAIKEAEQASR